MASKKTVSKKAASSVNTETKEAAPAMASAKSSVKKTTVAKKKTVATKPKTQTNKAIPSPADTSVAITPEQHYKLICETAYYLSLQHGDSDERSAINDWLQAEKTVNEKYRVTD